METVGSSAEQSPLRRDIRSRLVSRQHRRLESICACADNLRVQRESVSR